jgi:hypothetical protein
MKRSDLLLRWFMLLLACLMITGLYYCTDIPAALKPQLERYMKNKAEEDTEVYYGLLFSLYSVPNVRVFVILIAIYIYPTHLIS